MKLLSLCLFTVFLIVGTEAQSCANKNNGYYAHPSDCNKYYFCKGRLLTMYDCSTSRAGWAKEFFCSTDAVKKNIIKSVAVKSVKQPNGSYRNLCATVSAEGWLADSASCNLYFRCWKENNVYKQTRFDISAMCATSIYKTSCTKTGTGNLGNANLCANKIDGYYANPNNCNKYYYCSKKKVYSYDCTTAKSGFAKDFFCTQDTAKQAIIGSTTVKGTKLPSGNFRNQCSAEGWLADSHNCNQYYRCWSGTSGISQTSFDVTDICATSLYATACKRSPTTPTNPTDACATKADGFYPDPTDCTKAFRCAEKVKTEFTCTDVTLEGWKDVADFFCKTTETLPTLQFVDTEPDCATDGYFSVTTDCTKFHKCSAKTKTLLDFTEPGTGKCGDAYTEACKAETTTPAAGCEQKADGFYPDPEDCTKAYQCKADVKTEFTCTDVTPAEWKDVSDFFCKATETLATLQFADTEPDCATDGFFSVTTDCNKFHRCLTQVKTLIDVTEQGAAKCGSTLKEACEAKTTTPAAGCEQKADGFYPDPEDCTKAYQCKANVKTDFTCTDVTPAEWKDVADFFCKATETLPTVQYVAAEPDCTTDGFFSVTADCTKFHRCLTQVKTLIDITEQGAAKCGATYTDMCTAEKDVTCDAKPDGYYSVPSDCTKAYQCAANVKTDLSCADVTAPAEWVKISPFFCDEATTAAALTFAATKDCANDGWLSVTTDCNKYYSCETQVDTLVDITNAGPNMCGAAYATACEANK
ncbi:CHIA.2 family protein [Megaselia abdita]